MQHDTLTKKPSPRDATRPERFWIDPDGKIAFKDREACFTFGRHARRRLRDLLVTDPGYLRWILGENFSPEVKMVVSRVLFGMFPIAPPGSILDDAWTPAAQTTDSTETLPAQHRTPDDPTWREEDSTWGNS